MKVRCCAKPADAICSELEARKETLSLHYHSSILTRCTDYKVMMRVGETTSPSLASSLSSLSLIASHVPRHGNCKHRRHDLIRAFGTLLYALRSYGIMPLVSCIECLYLNDAFSLLQELPSPAAMQYTSSDWVLLPSSKSPSPSPNIGSLPVLSVLNGFFATPALSPEAYPWPTYPYALGGWARAAVIGPVLGSIVGSFAPQVES